jgi:protein-S-isoprenylcysteine O-methyltransferase Ste14
MAMFDLLIAHRTIDEEQFRVETFWEAYQDYRTAVLYKLIPYVLSVTARTAHLGTIGEFFE